MKKLSGVIFIFLVIFALGFFAYSFAERLAYQRPFSASVAKYAEVYSIEEFMVYSIMKAESGFDPNARSHKEAIGLMQVQQATAKWCAGRMGLPDNFDLWDPATNIQIGCYYFSHLLSRYKDVDVALAAYNAGSGNVDRWLQEDEYSRDGKSLYHIPFGETDRYVVNINKYYENYKRIYGE